MNCYEEGRREREIINALQRFPDLVDVPLLQWCIPQQGHDSDARQDDLSHFHSPLAFLCLSRKDWTDVERQSNML